MAFCCYLLTCELLSGNTALAQSGNELANLVFEPVLIASESNDNEITVTELTSLPQGGPAMGVTEYLFKNTAPDIPPVDINFEQTIAGYEKSIGALELQGGAYEPALGQEYLTLGTLYQSIGDHEKALEYFDKSLHNNRVNIGLYNLEQEKIIQEKIRSHIAQGDLVAADNQQEYLFYLKQRHFGSTSVELLPALAEYAEWNIFAFDSRLSMNPAFTYAAQSSAYTENSVNNAYGEEDFKTTRLVHAQNLYRTILQILINNYGATDPRLLDIEKKLALTNYFFATNLDVNNAAFSSAANSPAAFNGSQGYYDISRVSSNSLGYRHGREALERRLDYMLHMEGVSPIEIARARLELADWLMIFKKRMAALELYQQTYQELSATDTAPEIIDDIFNPLIPVVIPTFITSRYSRAALQIPEDQPLDYQGWFDMRIGLNKFGQTTRIEVTGRSEDSGDAIEDRLVRKLRSSTAFRPRIRNGSLLESDEITLRYYYSF